MNAIFNPTQMYDDIKICNNTGVYKTNNNGNTQGLFGGENDYLKNLKPNDNNVVLSLNEINVYPNPTNSVINIQYSISDDTKFELFDLLGRKIIETNLNSTAIKYTVDISKYSKGVYLYKISNKKQILKMDKITIN